MVVTDDFRDFVWTLDLSDARLVEQAMLICEAYEQAHICRQRIEMKVDDALRGFGFDC